MFKVVYVLNSDGQPLMPTERHGKVRRLLKSGKAKVIKRCPFTIKLLYDTGNIVQDVTLGVDAGSRHIGLSATTDRKELIASEVTLREDITKLLSERRQCRRSRRNRKTRYRPARFENRTHSKHEGWLAPSVENKINTHLKAVDDVCRILPINRIIVETASFDLQKLKADMEGLKYPQGTEYQQGEQSGFWNVREYVLFRDGHKCKCCKGKTKDKVLEVHHIESRMTGGDAPNNLITLCRTCHKGYHAGTVKLPSDIKRGTSFGDATFMGIMRWALYDRLKATYPNVRMTYGYLTKEMRIENGLDKTHCVDARVISGNPAAEPSDSVYFQVARRRHNRQIHKMTIGKDGYRKLNQTPKYVFGYQLFDKVLYNGTESFVYGRRTSGSFKVCDINGVCLKDGISYKKLKLLEKRRTILTERRARLLS